MKLFNGMTRRQRIDFLARATIRANRELSVVGLQVLAVIASMDTVNLPHIRRRRSALLLAINMAREELELLFYEEGDAQADEAAHAMDDDDDPPTKLTRLEMLEGTLALVWREWSVLALQALAVASTNDATRLAIVNVRLLALERLANATLLEAEFLSDERGDDDEDEEEGR
jgi:hypothetical protein